MKKIRIKFVGFEEYENNILMDPCTPDIEKLLQSIAKSYSDISEFLKDENRDPIQEELIEDYIYHETTFKIKDKFVKRYKK